MKMEVASMISTAFGDGRLSRTRGSRKLTGFRTALWVVEHTVLTTVGRRGLGEPPCQELGGLQIMEAVARDETLQESYSPSGCAETSSGQISLWLNLPVLDILTRL